MEVLGKRVKVNSKKVSNFVLITFFKLVALSLTLAASFPEKKPLKNQLKNFLLYKVWPVVFIFIWVPLVPMVALKILQFFANRDWEALLDITHMFIIGCLALYVGWVVQMTSRNYKNAVEIMQKRFYTLKSVNFEDLFIVFILWILLVLSFLMFIVYCLYYGENLVPLWIPFIDNDEKLPDYIFYMIWVYEGFAAPYIFLAYGVLGPFIIVSTVCIRKELDYLVKSIDNFELWRIGNKQTSSSPNKILLNLYKNSFNENRMDQFVKEVVEHHLTIMSAFENVSRLNNFIFLVQTVSLVIHSCFMAFNIYYTEHVEKVLQKAAPIVFFSYFSLFAYCWNGQRITDKCEELNHALYRCPWYNYPHSTKKSFLFMMEIYKRPVHLTGRGLFPATLQTFLTCLQQSVSYVLILKELTPDKHSP